MKVKTPDEVLCQKHLAFRTQFTQFGREWYVVIKPDWFFSSNGYHKSYYHTDRVDYLKKTENNQNVVNHVRFIAYFLSYDEPSDLFVERHPYPFLSFGELLSFDSAPILHDKEWLPSEPKEKRSKLEDSEQLPLQL